MILLYPSISLCYVLSPSPPHRPFSRSPRPHRGSLQTPAEDAAGFGGHGRAAQPSPQNSPAEHPAATHPLPGHISPLCQDWGVPAPTALMPSRLHPGGHIHKERLQDESPNSAKHRSPRSLVSASAEVGCSLAKHMHKSQRRAELGRLAPSQSHLLGPLHPPTGLILPGPGSLLLTAQHLPTQLCSEPPGFLGTCPPTHRSRPRRLCRLPRKSAPTQLSPAAG